MIKYFKKAFKITNENIILATPMVFFLLLLSIYLGVANNAPTNLFSAILLLITILFMVSAFAAGWFFMVKKAIELDSKEFIMDDEKAKASFKLIKEFPVGIGEYFLPFIGVLIFYVLLVSLVAIFVYKMGIHFIGSPGLSLDQLKIAFETPAAMKALVLSLSKEQLIKLNAWEFLFFSTSAVFSFITMFWAAHVIMVNKNPFLAFFQSVGVIFKNFFASIILFLYISFVNFSVSLINTLATVNSILYFISMLIYFYFIVYVVVLIFLYYDKEVIKNTSKENEVQQDVQSEIETENNSDSGSDSDGQD